MSPLFGGPEPTTHADPCGCQWQDEQRTTLFSHCAQHQLQSRLVEMPAPIRDSWIRRLLDAELDKELLEIARSGRGCRAEAKQALGPKPKDAP